MQFRSAGHAILEACLELEAAGQGRRGKASVIFEDWDGRSSAAAVCTWAHRELLSECRSARTTPPI
eukprot:COSAG06_NODE_14005_length_1198_cov_1.325751_2_plen_65_part_01